MSKSKSLVHPDCQNFVAVVEELLQRRQQEAKQNGRHAPAWYQDDWGPRTWIRTELEDMVYSSYKPMRQGRVTRPPRRETVMEIADYLNCTLEERNRLLIAAATTPISPYLTGDGLAEVLPVAIAVAQSLAMPSVIINRDWHIHYINEHMLRLQDISPEQLTAVAPDHFNTLHLLFNPQLPSYPYLTQDQESWTRMARQTIYGFKMANQLCQFEPWYEALIAQLLPLPQFEFHWRTVTVDKNFGYDLSAHNHPLAITLDTIVPHTQPHPKRVSLRPLLISVGYFQFDFPQIVGFVPANDESRAVFAEIGLPLYAE